MASNKLGIILPTKKSSAEDVLELGESVVNGLTTHVGQFPNPVVKIEDLSAAVTALDAAILPENSRSNNTNMVMEQKKGELLDLLSKEANFVLLIANGDRSIAGLSGFTLSKDEKSPNNPTTLELKKVSTGSSAGTATVSLKDRAGCAIFLVMLKNGEGDYKMFDAFNTTAFELTGLPAGESLLRIYGKKGKKKTPTLDVVVRAS